MAKLTKLKLINFKGLKNLEVDINADVNEFAGENGTFKTTLYDAILWCPTGKDHLGRENYEIKTIVDDKVVHGLEHSVEQEYESFSIKRVYSEKWVQKRGTPEKKFSGHTTDFYIDYKDGTGMQEVKKSEFDKFVKANLRADLFILLTNPFEFSEMHWKKRRDIVVEIAGDVTDDEIFQKMDNDDAEIVKKLTQNSLLEDALARLKKSATSVNDEIQDTVIRIDEATNSLPDVTGDRKELELKISEKKSDMELLTVRLRKIDVSADLYENLEKARRKKSEIVERENSEHQKKLSEFNRKKFETEEGYYGEKMSLERDIRSFELRLSDAGRIKANTEKAIEDLKKEFKETKEKAWDGSETCPTCNRKLAQSKIDEAQKEHKRKQALKLKSINESAEFYEKELASANKILEEVAVLEDMKETLAKLKKPECGTYERKPLDLSEYDKEIGEAESKLANAKETIDERKLPVREEIKEVEELIEDLRKELAVFEEKDRLEKRISEHRKRLDELVEQHSDYMKKINSLEKFIFTKVEMMKPDIRKHFGMDFKMIDRQINGGLNECCEVVVDCDGNQIPFSTANNAGRINTGIKLCSILQKHYGAEVPVVIDNAESVVKIEPSGCQVIKLTVNKKYKKLTKI